MDSFGVSSRTLRYYEQVGILWSSHPENKQQRYYDAAALERLRQIIVLRKLQIPIKDIIRIFSGEGTAALVRAFVSKLGTLDGEIAALSELRRLVDSFLQKMMASGIRKISAITLLYEETEKRLGPPADDAPVTFAELSRISRDALRLHDVRIIRLPPSRVLTSRLKAGGLAGLDGDAMQNLFAEYGLVPAPGLRNCFYRKEPGGEWLMLMRVPDDFDNTTVYADEAFPGGLFAVASSFMEDMDDTFALLRDWVRASGDFAPGPGRGMIEEILPWDIANRTGRYQQDVFVPIREKANREG